MNSILQAATRFLPSLVAITCLACVPELHAQDARLGGIRGRITDADFGGAVGGALVVVEGVGRSTQTTSEGSFVIPGIPPGRYDVAVSRDGYFRLRIPDLIVPSGSFVETDGRMEAEVVELDDFVIALEELDPGSKLSIIDIQQSQNAIASYMGSDFIAKLGGADVGKALQKVAGVNVIGDRYVAIRGLSDRYNTILLNNTGLPSSDPDRRAVNIDLFPGSIVRRLEVKKSFTPDLPGESSGGSINIETKGVPEKSEFKLKLTTGVNQNATDNDKFLINPQGGTGMFGTLESRRIPSFIQNAELGNPIRGEANINDPEERKFRDKVNSSLSKFFGTQTKAPQNDFSFEGSAAYRSEFWGRPAGLLFATEYRKNYTYEPNGIRGSQAGNPFPGVFQRGADNLRASFLLVGGVEPQPGDEVKLTLFANLAAQSRASIRRTPVQESGDLRFLESLVYVERRLQVLQASGRHHWGDELNEERAVLKWVASYNQSSQDEPDSRFTELLFNNGTFFQEGAPPVPPIRRYWRELDDDKYTLGLDFTYLMWEQEEQKAQFKAGGNFDHSDRSYRADSFAYNIGKGTFPDNGFPSPFPGATFADAFLFTDNNVSRDGLQSFFLNRIVDPEVYTASQTIAGGFALIDVDFSKNFNVNIGVRVEETQIGITTPGLLTATYDNTEANQLSAAIFSGAEFTSDDRAAAASALQGNDNPRGKSLLADASNFKLFETSVLPALNLSWKLNDEMKLRGAVTRTIARPSLKELAPVPFREVEKPEETFFGNPGLQISNITNYDLRFEYFRKEGGSLAASVFSKFIQDPIERSRPPGQASSIVFVNSPDSVVYGFELEGETSLGFLAPQLKNISITSNYTFLRSQVPRTSRAEGANTINRRLQGQPDYIFNFNVNYDNPDTGLAAGVFLNVTGAYLEIVGGDAGSSEDVFAQPITTLNAFVSYKLSKYGKLTFRATNLTGEAQQLRNDPSNTPFELLTGTPSYSLSYEMNF